MTSHGIVVYRGKILLILRDDKPDIPYPNFWAPVGGNAFSSELPEETLKRELKEEANISVKNFTYLGDMQLDAHLYLVKISDEDRKKIKKGSEGQKLEFFEIEKLDDLHLATKFKNFYEKEKAAIKKAIKEL